MARADSGAIVALGASLIFLVLCRLRFHHYQIRAPAEPFLAGKDDRERNEVFVL